MTLVPWPMLARATGRRLRTGWRGAASAMLLLAGLPAGALAARGTGAVPAAPRPLAAAELAAADSIAPATVTDLGDPVPVPVSGRVSLLPTNRRYLRDVSGVPLVLVGFGNEIKNPPSVLSQLGGRINYLRTYAASWDTRRSASEYALGRPWPTVGGKSNMDAWNETYWSNLRDYLSNARQQGIIVGLTLWDGHYDLPGGKAGSYSTWNAGSNVQGVQWAYNASALTQYPNPSPSGGAAERLVYYQRRWVDRLLTEVAPYPNVILELDNETDQASTAWWLWWADHILASGTYVIATTWNSSYTIPDGVVASDSRLHMKSYHDRNDAVISSQRYSWGKVIVADADIDCSNIDGATARRLAWRSVMRGGHWNDFVCLDQPYPDTGKLEFYRHLLDFIRNSGVPLWDMSPHNELVTSGLALAQPGSHYLVYTDANVTVNLSAATGAMSWQWYNPRNGTTASSGTVAGGASRLFTLPGSGDYVLRITR